MKGNLEEIGRVRGWKQHGGWMYDRASLECYADSVDKEVGALQGRRRERASRLEKRR